MPLDVLVTKYLERNKGLSNAVIVGIERRGVMLAKRLQSEIEAIEGLHIECEPLNVAIVIAMVSGYAT